MSQARPPSCHHHQGTEQCPASVAGPCPMFPVSPGFMHAAIPGK